MSASDGEKKGWPKEITGLELKYKQDIFDTLQAIVVLVSG